MKICTIGIWDESIPGISFDENGVSNYAKFQLKMMQIFPRGQHGDNEWKKIVKDVIKSGHGKKYDCIVGVSGGVDSSYLLHTLKKDYGLRPLALNLDNGWSSDIALKNIKKMTSALGVDLETFVIDYEEIKDLLRSFMKAGLPWIDTPTDTAIKSIMYSTALKLKVKYIFRGNDFRSEGKQPLEWTYSDPRQIKYVFKKFGELRKLKTFPFLPYYKIILSRFFKGIREIRPYYYLNYNKQDARKFLEANYEWEYYGGHHHENLFTKFTMSYWLPEKFNIEKRKISLSAQILSNAISREKALEEITLQPYDSDFVKNDLGFVLKKLDLSEKEFKLIWNSTNKSIYDYPSHLYLIKLLYKRFYPLIKFIYPQNPMTFEFIESNDSTGNGLKSST